MSDFGRPLKINIVTVYQGWILHHIADRIIDTCYPNIEWTKSEYAIAGGDYDITFYCDIYNCFARKTNFDIGLFTHLDKDSMDSFQESWKQLDHIVHMNQRYFDMFSSVYLKEKMSVIHPFDVSRFQIKKPVIGIFQRGEYEGKGATFMPLFLTQEICKYFKFVFVGKGWHESIRVANEKSIEIEWHDDGDYSDYQKLYHKVDYVLIPSLWEGGPMAIAEAMAQGIPIISADVGWAGKDFPVDHIFPPGDVRSLMAIFEQIRNQKLARRALVESKSYRGVVDQIIRAFNEKQAVCNLPLFS